MRWTSNLRRRAAALRDEHLYALHVLTIRILRSPRIATSGVLVQRDFIVLPVGDETVRMG